MHQVALMLVGAFGLKQITRSMKLRNFYLEQALLITGGARPNRLPVCIQQQCHSGSSITKNSMENKVVKKWGTKQVLPGVQPTFLAKNGGITGMTSVIVQRCANSDSLTVL